MLTFALMSKKQWLVKTAFILAQIKAVISIIIFFTRPKGGGVGIWFHLKTSFIKENTISFLSLFLFLIEFIGMTLVNTVIKVSGVQFYNA